MTETNPLRTFLTTTRELCEKASDVSFYQAHATGYDRANMRSMGILASHNHTPYLWKENAEFIQSARSSLPLSLDLLAMAVEALEKIEEIGTKEYAGEPAWNVQAALARECLTAMAEKLKETR